ncbi:methanogenesis marker protein 12 [Methanosalsum zhilinae DSM 4017]|uniref:UPF0285 protein Mzhil_1003 n=1 Tax=Methanosalsum zhilinae (strain DSM 4017 / NBRC 107636 / OCM 62 / WeN5) TaxID=679901 RepID=F7XLQ8_METZD|nr:methanogenesis marker 12 protein [Methanosalsum zhilinae]AEH60860.1 methanogenesis marker protein 12 [Methanosalsum zhilinae DSM 4017]
MFLGIDHGTTAIRFASLLDGTINKFEIARSKLISIPESELIEHIGLNLNVDMNKIKLIALTYSMGDGIISIEDIKHLKNRGIKSNRGVGNRIGAGELVFDAVKKSDIPSVVIPGIHSKSGTDPRLNIFSHSTSPEKIGIAYHAKCMGYNNYVVSDISSNTVTLAVANGEIKGAIDACIFAPGVHHGPLDVQAIRDVDEGLYTANDAFTKGGVLKRTPYSNLKELLNAFSRNEKDAILALDTIALFAAMEINSLQLLLKDYDLQGEVFLAGSVGDIEYVVDKINGTLGLKSQILGKWSAAVGCAEIARDIAYGSRKILGINVNFDSAEMEHFPDERKR